MGQTDCFLVPEDKKFDVFRMAHEIPSSGHFRIHATAVLALLHFWYPGLNTDIRNRIKSCMVCIQKDIHVQAHTCQVQMDFLDKHYMLIWCR
ncbi:MAG: hypothetical protein GY696_05415 [Gammaproteobacteria bacterium]|nr:hypothetical protein [Gammaproteobacteria bacterium]